MSSGALCFGVFVFGVLVFVVWCGVFFVFFVTFGFLDVCLEFGVPCFGVVWLMVVGRCSFCVVCCVLLCCVFFCSLCVVDCRLAFVVYSLCCV